MSIRRKYAKTTFLSTILTNVGFIINLIYGRILADTISQANMGIIAAMTTLSRIILSLSLFGIHYTITQKTSFSIGKGQDERAKHILAKGLVIFYAISIPISILLSLVSLFILNNYFFFDLYAFSGILILYLVLLLTLRGQSDAMNSMVETDRAVVLTNLRRWTSWGLSLWFLFFLASFIGIFYGWIISVGLFIIIGAVFITKYFHGAKINLGLPTKTYLTFGLAIFGASVVRLFGQYIDQLFILALMTQEELARYFLVVRITGALFDFAISLISGIVALLAVLVGISLTRMQNAHLAVIRFVLVISAPIFIAVAAFGEPLATLFMGPQYLGSGILLSILMGCLITPICWFLKLPCLII